MIYINKLFFNSMGIMSLLPLSILYIISKILFFITYYIIKYRRDIIINNLEKSFPKKNKKEIKKMSKKYYQNFCDILMEIVKMISISKTTLEKRFQYENIEMIEKYIKKNQTIILCLGHYANWEWGLLSISNKTTANILGVYKEIKNKYINDKILEIRSKFGAKLSNMRNCLKIIQQEKEKANIICLITDQSPKTPENKYWGVFLNQETSIMTGVEKISKKYNYPVIFANINQVKKGYYKVIFQEISNKPKETNKFEKTKKHTQQLEKQILTNPTFWLWSHKRWKHKKKK